MSCEIMFHVERHIGIITLNRISSHNALTLPMIHMLYQHISQWNDDESVHAIVIQSASDKAFCAGGDVRFLYEAGKHGDVNQLDFFKFEYQLNLLISQLKKPYIALMNGLTMGGGVGISLHGSHPVASPDFIFAMPETSIGFFPDIGASFLLSRLANHYGIYLGLTGNRLDAFAALQLGLVKQVIAKDAFSKILADLMHEDLSSDAYEQVDNCLNKYQINGQPVLNDTDFVETSFQCGQVEDILNALEQGGDPWHCQILNTLQTKSPLSLKVTLAQLHKARHKNLAQCLVMDYCLVGHFMHDHDFYEGVRALLIDKDKSPKWQPATLEEVSMEQVNNYFICEPVKFLS